MMAINYFAEIFTTFIECYMLLWTYNLCLAPRFSNKAHKVTIFVSTVFITALTLWVNSLKLVFLPYTYIWLAILFTLGCVLYKANPIKILTICSVYVLWISFVDFFFLTFLEFALGFEGIIARLTSEMCFARSIYIVFVKSVYIALYVLLRHKLGSSRPALSTINCIFIIMYCWICIPSLTTLFGAIVTDDIMLMKRSTLFACVLVILGIIGLLALFSAQNRLRRKEYESQAIQSQIEILENDNQQLNKAHHEISKLSHDFKSHIHTITDLAKHGSTDELCAYLDELSEDLQSADNVAYTGVESIDAVINRKISQAREAGIIVNISASYAGRIRNIDLCVMLSNIFDNAIDACKRVTDVKKRFINCSISEVGKMAVIKMENSYDSAITLEKRGDDIVTTKENANVHGYGLKIVRSIVEKYNGTIETTNDEKSFSVYILLNN